jgi:hypothetical protein
MATVAALLAELLNQQSFRWTRSPGYRRNMTWRMMTRSCSLYTVDRWEVIATGRRQMVAKNRFVHFDNHRRFFGQLGSVKLMVSRI